MYATSENEAVDNFIHFLQETLSCVTDAHLIGFQQSKHLRKVWFNPAARVTKRPTGYRYVFVTQVFTVTKIPMQPRFFKVNTREYSYRLSDSQNVNDADLIAYHWHPNEFEVRYPHLHVRALKRVHFPTSRVCLEDFVRLMIDYYDVRPRLAHPEWKGILEKNKRAFDKGASWKIMPAG